MHSGIDADKVLYEASSKDGMQSVSPTEVITPRINVIAKLLLNFFNRMRCNRQLPCESCTRLGFECTFNAPQLQNYPRRPRALDPEVLPDGVPGSSPAFRSRGGPKVLHPTLVTTEFKGDSLSQEIMAELEQIYFSSTHQSFSMLHKPRYNLAIMSEPRLRPPRYLRDIVCALGALVSEKYSSLHENLYMSALRKLNDIEFQDASPASNTLARPQAWILIAVYEGLRMYFHRYSSSAKAARTAQMMGLHVIDGTRRLRRSLAPAKDWTEIEERRRTFWMAFSLDRQTGFCVGCPGIIDVKDIRTLLPTFDEAYESCTEAPSLTLHEALQTKDIAALPPLAAALVITADTGIKLKLLQEDDLAVAGHDPHPSDLWQKITWLDSSLRFAFSVPPHLAASGFAHTPFLTYLHMCAPTYTILLHVAAEEQASSHGITPSRLQDSQAMRLAAAEIVASTMRLASHLTVSSLHPFTGACLYAAARVLMRALSVRSDAAQCKSLLVLLDALTAIQSIDPSRGGFLAELDTEFPGLRASLWPRLKVDEDLDALADQNLEELEFNIDRESSLGHDVLILDYYTP